MKVRSMVNEIMAQIPIQRLEMLIWNPKIAKVEFGDNFVVISNELENGDLFYVLLQQVLA
jgi:hypothetical protein